MAGLFIVGRLLRRFSQNREQSRLSLRWPPVAADGEPDPANDLARRVGQRDQHARLQLVVNLIY